MAETKYIFVTGGVVSSLGKGIISSSIGKLLQARGYNITIQKFDPYINIDPGTLNPYEHGECYVTVDGMETDLDLGHYERFTGIQTTKANSLTTGRIYKAVIDKAIAEAVEDAKKDGIHGKATTPYLLAKIKDLTGGDSLDSNIQLVFNNARLGAAAAVELAKLER